MGRSTREQWAERVARWKDSGQPAAEFASEIGVRARTLAWWRWRLEAKAPSRLRKKKTTLARRPPVPIVKTPTTVSPLTFVEMAAAVETDRLEVVLPSSVRVRVRPGFDSTTLDRVLDVLEARR